MAEHLRVLELGEGLDEVEEQPLTMMMVDGITVIVGRHQGAARLHSALTRARDGARQGTPRGFCSFALPCLAPWVFGRALPCLAPWDSGRALPCPVGFWACPVGALPRAPRGMLPQRAML